MAGNAGEDPSPYSTTASYFNILVRVFASNTEFLSYLILCVVKMPFIPPVSVSRPTSFIGPTSVPTSRETLRSTTSLASTFKTKVLVEAKSSSVKEQLASDLRHLGRRGQPRNHLPVSRCPQQSGLCVEGSNQRFHSKKTPPMDIQDSSCGSCNTSPRSCSSESLSQQEDTHTPEMRSEPEAENDGAHFRLTLTPEAVWLLQRQNRERIKLSAARSGPMPAGDSRCRQETVCKRHQAGENGGEAIVSDVSSLLKISLLNDRHKYDDVEYEEELSRAVDEGVVMKCTEWLRGLESAPFTVNNSMEKSVTSLKSF